MHHRLATAAILLTANATAAPPSFDSDHDLDWAPGSTGIFQHAVAIQYTQDKTLDAVVLRSGEAHLIYGPARYSVATLVGSGVLDLAVAARSGIGGCDALITAGASGVTVHWEDLQNADQAATLSADPFESIAAGALSATSNGDLVARGDDPRTLRVFLRGPSGPGDYTETTSIASAFDILDHRIVDVDADGVGEIAMLTTLGVEVVEADGTLGPVYAHSPSGGCLTLLAEPGQVERLAWVRPTFDGTADELTVIDSNGATAPLQLGALGTVAITSGDFDQDGFDDLAVSYTASRQLLLLENLGSSGDFGVAAGQTATVDVHHDPAQPAPENQASPVAGDFDADGDVDLLFASQSLDSIWLARNEASDHTTQVVQMSSLAYVEAADLQAYLDDPTGANGWDPNSPPISSDGYLAIRVLPPVATVPAGYDHFDVIVWRRPDESSSGAAIAVEHSLFAVPAGWSASSPADLLIDIHESSFPFAAVYDVEIRLVQTQPNGLRRGTPIYSGAFATDPATMAAFEAGPDPYYAVELYTPDENAYMNAVEAGGFVSTYQTPLFVTQKPKPQAPAEKDFSSSGAS